jgi:hypothetical protein
MDISFSISFHGATADSARLQFYDAAKALEGFERVLSLTSHLLLTGEIITKSPAAKGFQLSILPPEEGSWAARILLAVTVLGTASRDSVFGWLAHSAVEYVLQESIGLTPDFDKTLGPQLRKYMGGDSAPIISPNLDQQRFDSLIEKCEEGVKAIHRPIAFSGSAQSARIYSSSIDRRVPMNLEANLDSYLYVSRTISRDDVTKLDGMISSYNVNTARGRIFVPQLGRTIPFVLDKIAINPRAIRLIVASLQANAIALAKNSNSIRADISLAGHRQESIHGRLKSFLVIGVSDVKEKH